MIYKPAFQNRIHAGKLLSEKINSWLVENADIPRDDIVILSLLRGGYPVGKVVEEEIGVKHIPITAAKIGVPGQEEVALGALCFDSIYINKDVDLRLREYLGPNYESLVALQIEKAREKLAKYSNKYGLVKDETCKMIRDKVIFIVDDGVATGASAKSVASFARDCESRKVVLAVPVAPSDFKCRGYFDECIILIRDPAFMAVGRYYEDFRQVEI